MKKFKLILNIILWTIVTIIGALIIPVVILETIFGMFLLLLGLFCSFLNGYELRYGVEFNGNREDKYYD